MTADEIKKLLGLVPHPREGGCYTRTYESNEMVSLERYPAPRHTGTAIYYLLEPNTFSPMHRLKSDEIFHFYAGDPVEMLQLREGAPGRIVAIGADLAAGQRPQVVVPHGTWQGCRLGKGGAWALLGCTVSPGFEYEDYADADEAELLGLWPEWAEMIAALTKH
jgi:predicted cupin superfamily sugar epimerase